MTLGIGAADLRNVRPPGRSRRADPLAVRDPIQNSCPRRDVINPAALRPIPIRLHNDVGRQHAGHSDRPASEVHR